MISWWYSVGLLMKGGLYASPVHCWMDHTHLMFTVINWLTDSRHSRQQLLSTMFQFLPSTAAALSLVTSALSRLSTCLSLQINNKANVVTSPKEPVPTPSLVHCLPALLPACLHDCRCLSSYLSVHTFSGSESRLCSSIELLVLTHPFSLDGDCFFP